jgi:hypothetical protein
LQEAIEIPGCMPHFMKLKFKTIFFIVKCFRKEAGGFSRNRAQDP